MTGVARQTRTDAVGVKTQELIAKIGSFAVFSSVNGHAQAAVVIRARLPREVELAQLARTTTPTL